MKKKYNLFLYDLLSRFSFLNSFISKTIFVAVVSASFAVIPFIIILAYYKLELSLMVILCLLFFSSFFLGMALLAVFLRSLITPVFLVSNSLKNYIKRRDLPVIPKGYTDEFGVLMSDVQEFIETVDKNSPKIFL